MGSLFVTAGTFPVPDEPPQRLLSLQWVAGELDVGEGARLELRLPRPPPDGVDASVGNRHDNASATGAGS